MSLVAIQRGCTAVFVKALREFKCVPGVNTLAKVFLSSKALLAKQRQSGGAGQEAGLAALL